MSCCPPSADCIQCPIIVSCIPNLILAPGQLQFCPDNCKFYYDCAGVKTCLNPTYGLGLRMTENCILQVGLAPNRPLVFDDAGNIDIDCEKLVACCNLVNQYQLSIAVTNLYNSVNTALSAVQQPKRCDGITTLTSSDAVYQVGSLKKLTPAGPANLECGDTVVLWGDLLKCLGDGTSVPLALGDLLVTQANCVVPVGSPPTVGSPPVGSPPVGSPPPVGGGCCDLANSGAKIYSESFTAAGVSTGSVAPVWAFSYACAANAYIPFAIALVAGSLPPGLSLNGVDPNSDGANNYYFQGFSGAVVVPAVTTTYNFTIKVAPFDINSACYSLADIQFTINVESGSPPPVGSPPPI